MRKVVKLTVTDIKSFYKCLFWGQSKSIFLKKSYKELNVVKLKFDLLRLCYLVSQALKVKL